MADEMGKTIFVNIKTELDKQSLNQIEKQFKESTLGKLNLTDEEKKAFLDEFRASKEKQMQTETYKKFSEELKKMGIGKDLIKEFEKNIPKETFKERLSKMGEEFSESFADTIKNFVLKGSKSVAARFGTIVASMLIEAAQKIAEIIKDAFKEAKEEIADLATYDLQNSLFYNREASSLYLNYGLQGEDAYAFNKASQMLGYSGFSELMSNPWTMNEEMYIEFQELVSMYKDQYKESKEFSLEYQKFQLEFKEFKEEFMMEFMDIFIQNKDIIIGAMKAIMKILDGVLKIVDWLTNALSFGGRTEAEKSGAVYDILGIEGSSNNSLSFVMNNTYNGIGQKDQEWISNTNNITLSQAKRIYK